MVRAPRRILNPAEVDTLTTVLRTHWNLVAAMLLGDLRRCEGSKAPGGSSTLNAKRHVKRPDL